MSEIYSKIIEFVEDQISGKPNIVCFQNMTEFVVNDKWFSKREKEYLNDEAE